MANLIGLALLSFGMVISVAAGRAVLGVILSMFFDTAKPQPPLA